ncbi:MAG TPA: hypothetical protein VNI78_07160, partial [Vicinamibacterales bacterium]|nr:hypothetical protein [Vicinamibacterales bacterium]
MRLLNPDCQVAHLYAQIPILDHDGLLRAMLQSSAPERFADAILGALRSEEEGSVVLPRDPKLLELLRKTAWLPGRANGSPVAPEKLLILPGELHDSIAPLAAAGCLGDHRLVSAVDPGFWQPAEEAVRELIGKPAAATQLEQLSTALATDTLARVNGGAYLVFTDAARLTTALIENALQSPLCSAHQGWALLSAAAQALAIRGTPLDKAPESARKALVSLARRLCGPMPAEQQAATLNALATATPAHESPTYRLFCTLLDTFCQDSTFLKHVVSKLAALPTQDGQWRSPREIARSASGVAPRHLLVTALRKCLRLDSDRPAYQKGVDRPTSAPGVDTAQVLKSYFEPWRNMVPHQAIGLFLSLLGPGKRRAIVELAQRWLGEDVNIDGILQQVSTQLDVATSVRVFCSGVVASEGQVKALNPLGEWVEMETEPDSETLFAVDPQCLDHWRGDFWNPQLGDIEQGSSREAGSRQLVPFWHIQLRDVRPKQRTTHELLSLLRATVEWWGGRVLKLDQQSIRQWWSRYGESSQTQVQPVRASILAHLPLTLRQLDVRDSKPLAEALRKAERAQRAREQAPRKETQAAMDAERAALECLAQLVCDKKHQPFLLQRVRVLMERFGYREDSVLRELAQNADDALAQAAEIAGGPLPERARRLTIRVHKLDQTPTVDIIHYGRPINDTGGPAFPEGKERQWDLDLYFMMLLNLSTKPGEKPGEATAGSTTGRFGLGFKSVHLVSNCPSVVSGFLAFSIAGGLLPQKQRFPDDLELAPVDGHRPTRIRLPLRNDLANAELVDRMFDRFAYTRALLPAFARQVREVIVDEGPHAGASIFDGEPIKGAQGWTCSRTPVDLPGEGKWRILRFRPQDMTTTGESAKLANKANSRKQAKSLDTAHPIGPASTIALAVGLRDGLPAPFPEDFPFLWNVTPTSEAWACGYAINGPFKLDPGRTHVSLDDEATLQVVDLLGEALGNGLIALHQAILNDAKTAASLTSEPAKFLEQLWRVLTHGLNSEDPLRRKILLRLHKAGRGVSAWMSACSIVPSGLPAPFAQRLPPVRPDMIVEEACDGLANRAVCRALAQIDDLVSLLKDRPIVSSEVASRVRPLIALRLQRLGAGKLFEELVQSWDHLLTPERLHALRPLADEEAWQVLRSELPDSTWQSHLRARSVDKSRQPLSKLLLPPEALDARWRLDADIKDELLRAAFAPDSCILDPDYIRESADVAMFLRLRLRHKIDAATVAGWYDDLSSERQPAALRYLVHGHLRDEVLTHLVALERRPPWLRQYERVRKALDDLGEDEWRCQMLLAALFPDRFRTAAEPLAKPILSEAETRTFLQRLVEWWDDENVRRRVISDYEEKTWPAWLRREGLTQGLRDKSPDHWLALLVLGACQSLGRTREQQHRGFLEMVHCEGWWDVFRESGDDTSWMDVLRNWQDRTIARLEYLRWMSLFPSIYQFSRYWRTYCRLLISAQKRSANLLRVKSLLAPRSDETLSGAGQQFDAPPAPLDMGLHWVLRELVRLEVIQGEHLYPACWVPSEQVLRLLQRVGLEIGDDNLSNLEK